MIVVMTIILRLLIGILFRAKLISREYRYSHRLIFFFFALGQIQKGFHSQVLFATGKLPSLMLCP